MRLVVFVAGALAGALGGALAVAWAWGWLERQGLPTSDWTRGEPGRVPQWVWDEAMEAPVPQTMGDYGWRPSAGGWPRVPPS